MRSDPKSEQLNGTEPVDRSPSSGVSWPVTAPPRGRANRMVAFGILILMAVMAILALVFALATVPERRKRDLPPLPGRRAAAAVRETEPVPVRPAELAGLGFLQPDCNIVAAIHVADALCTPTGAALDERTDSGPGKLEALLENTTGVPLRDIDHVVLGLRLDESVARLTIALQTREPVDSAELARRLKANRPEDFEGKTLLHFPFLVGVLPFEALVWFAGDQSIVVTIRLDGAKPEDFQHLPAAPISGANHLSADLQALVKEKLGPCQAWVAGQTQGWLDHPVLAPGSLPEKDRQALGKLRLFAVELEFGQTAVGLRLTGHCKDEAAAREVEKALAQWKAQGDTVELIDKTWVVLKTTLTPEMLRQLLVRIPAKRSPTSKK
jgi:hypothetical protein